MPCYIPDRIRVTTAKLCYIPERIRVTTAKERKDQVKEIDRITEGEDVFISIAHVRPRMHRYTLVQKNLGELVLERKKEEGGNHGD